MAQAPPRDPITCHVLDTLTGRPAPNMDVTLKRLSPPAAEVFSATTNADGRIANWATATQGISVASRVQHDETSIWVLEFDTASYYNSKTFWPKVQLTFSVNPNEHFHVPLLLGPYSYTTYRGS